jgi:hypothetical protein
MREAAMKRFFIFVLGALICQTALGIPPKFHIEIFQPNSDALDINNFGKVIGKCNHWTCGDPPYFLYTDGNYQVLYGAASAFALNDQGFFLGRLADYSQFIGNGTTWEYLPAAITQNARYAEDLNDNGVIVGRHNGQSAFYYENGIYTEIGLYKGIGSSGHRINNAKQIAGSAYNGTNASPRTEAFLYDAGTFHDIGQLNNSNYSESYTYTNVSALNDFGAVVGDSNYRAYIYQDGVISAVPGLADFHYSRASDINNQGTVLGYYDMSATTSADTYWFLFFEGVLYRLTDLLTDLDGGTFQGFALNDHGDIAGRYGNSEGLYSFIATFIPPAVVEVDVDPWRVSNSVKPDSNDAIFVAVMGSRTANGDPIDFDVSQIDPATLKLGAGEAANIAVNPLLGDYDHDTISDAAFAFRTQDTGILCGDSDVTLEGETFNGDQFAGTSTIATTDCDTGGCHP